MRCPFCGHDDTAVKDSRAVDENTSIRRRRHCPECSARFTTIEHVQLLHLKVIKKNGDIEAFSRAKLARSMELALHKRPVEAEKRERVINSLVRQLESRGETEISCAEIGELVMQALNDLDAVAYVRFASVYRDFTAPDDFQSFVESIDLKTVQEEN